MEYFCSKKLLSKKKDKLLFSKDISKTGTKIYILSTIDDIVDKIKLKSDSIYELWDKNDPIYLAIDFDFIILPTEPFSYNYLIDFITDFSVYVKHKYNITINKNNIYVLKSTDNNGINYSKASFHIIFRDILFNNIDLAKEFMKIYKKNNKKKKYIDYIDTTIYYKTCLRTIYSMKNYGLNIFYPATIKDVTKDFSEDLVSSESYVDEEICTIFLGLIKDEIIKNTFITYTANSTVEIINFPIKKYQTTYNPNFSENYYLYIQDPYYIKDMLNMIKYKTSNFGEWMNVASSLVEIANSYDMYDEIKNIFVEWSQESSQSAMNNSLQFFNNLFEKTEYTKFPQKFLWILKNEGLLIDNNLTYNINLNVIKNKAKEIFIDQIELKYDKEINERYFTKEIFSNLMQYDIVYIKSEKGTGKTYNLLKTLVPINNSCLLITSKKTFATKLKSELDIYGFSAYFDIPEKMITSDKIICQIDSLSRITRNSFDYIILDEIETLCRYVTSTFFNRLSYAQLIIDFFKILLQNSKKLFIMDADLSTKSYNFINNIIQTPKNVFLLKNNYLLYDNIIVKSYTKKSWISTICQKCEENKKIVIASATKEMAKNINIILKYFFPNLKTLLIHSEIDEFEKEKFIYDINNEWIKYDVVIYTPSICMGISFDIEYFDDIFCFASSLSLPVKEFMQMVHRVRKIKSNTIHLLTNITYESNEIINETIVKEMMSNQLFCIRNNINLQLIKPQLVINKNQREIFYNDEIFFKLIVSNITESLYSRYSLITSLYNYLLEKQYIIQEKIENYVNPSYEKYEKLLKNKKSEELTKNSNEILQASNITLDEYEVIKKNFKSKTLDEVTKMKKFYYIKKYNLLENQLTLNIIKKYFNEKSLTIYTNMQKIIVSPEYIAEIYNYRSSIINISISKIKFAYDILNICHFNVLEMNKCVFKDDVENGIKIIYNYIINKKNFLALNFLYNIKISDIFDSENINNIMLKKINNLINSLFKIKIKLKNNYYKLCDCNNFWFFLTEIKSIKFYNLKNLFFKDEEKEEVYNMFNDTIIQLKPNIKYINFIGEPKPPTFEFKYDDESEEDEEEEAIEENIFEIFDN